MTGALEQFLRRPSPCPPGNHEWTIPGEGAEIEYWQLCHCRQRIYVWPGQFTDAPGVTVLERPGHGN